MKIIGQTDRTYIIEASKDEIANLIGYYYTGSDGCPHLKPGDQIQVSAMYSKLSALKNNRWQLNSAISYLEGIAKSLELLKPIIEVPEPAGVEEMAERGCR